MGAQVSAGNTTIDESKTIRENIQNIILENIQKSKYTTKTSANSNQQINLDCSDFAIEYLKLWKSNWGVPPSPEDFAKACTATDITFSSNIDLNVSAQQRDDFSSQTDSDIKTDFKQIASQLKEQPTLGIEIDNESKNAAEYLETIELNVKNSNIKETIIDILTDANVTQTLNIKLGQARNVQMQSKILLIITSLTEQFTKNIDKKVLDSKVIQDTSKKSENTFVKTIGGIFNNAIDGISNIVTTATQTGAMMYIITIAIVGFIIYIFGPCNIPYISKFCTKNTIKNTQDTINKRSKKNNNSNNKD